MKLFNSKFNSALALFLGVGSLSGDTETVPVGHIWKFDLERSKKHLILE